MSVSVLFKVVVLALLALILVSLGSGLLFLVRDQGRTRRVISSLTVRIVLSVTLFFILLIGYFTGLIKPHGITPAPTETPSE